VDSPPRVTLAAPEALWVDAVPGNSIVPNDPIETIFLVWLRTSKELTPDNYPEFFASLDSAYAVEILTPSLVLIRAGKLDVLYFENIFRRTLGSEQWLITQTNGISYRLPPEVGDRVYRFVKQSQIWQSAPPW
jgi:hypothetical protein